MAVVAASLAIRVVRAINLVRVLTKPGHEFDRSTHSEPQLNISSFSSLSFLFPSSIILPCFSQTFLLILLSKDSLGHPTHSPRVLSSFLLSEKWIPASFHRNAQAVDSTLLKFRAPIQRFFSLFLFISLETWNVSFQTEEEERFLPRDTHTLQFPALPSLFDSYSSSSFSSTSFFLLILLPSLSPNDFHNSHCHFTLKIDTCFGRIHTINWFAVSFCHLRLIVECLRKKNCQSNLIPLFPPSHPPSCSFPRNREALRGCTTFLPLVPLMTR